MSFFIGLSLVIADCVGAQSGDDRGNVVPGGARQVVAALPGIVAVTVRAFQVERATVSVGHGGRASAQVGEMGICCRVGAELAGASCFGAVKGTLRDHVKREWEQ